jgi:hypothetical protein
MTKQQKTLLKSLLIKVDTTVKEIKDLAMYASFPFVFPLSDIRDHGTKEHEIIRLCNKLEATAMSIKKDLGWKEK